MNITPSDFAGRVLCAVREEAKNQGITQGAMAICFAPTANLTREWLNTPEGTFGEASVTYTYPIVDGGSTIYADADGNEKGDCAGVVAMKITAAKRAIMHHDASHHLASRQEHTSGACPDQYNGNGRINWKGCIAVPIGYLTGGWCGRQGSDVMMIYICVSGGTQIQDEAAAWAALPVIRDIINKEDGYMVHRSFLSDDTEYTEESTKAPDQAES